MTCSDRRMNSTQPETPLHVCKLCHLLQQKIQWEENATEVNVPLVLHTWLSKTPAWDNVALAWMSCSLLCCNERAASKKSMYLPLGPSRRHVSRVLSLFLNFCRKVWTVANTCACRSPQSSIPFGLWCWNWMSFLAGCTAVTFAWHAHTKDKAECYHKDSNHYWLSTWNHAQKRCCKKIGIADEPGQLKSVDRVIKCRFHLIKSFEEISHGHFDAVIHFPELFTKE